MGEPDPLIGPDSGDPTLPAGAATEHIVESTRRVAPTAVVLVALAIVATRRYIGMANADALLPSLMSTQKWTLFYWGQDRLANLVPLLAMPVRDPIWNFRIQSLIIASAFFALCAVFVSYHAWSRSERARPVEHAVATGLTGLAVMTPMHAVAGYRFAIEQLYVVSVLCWVVAVWAWLRPRRPTSGFLALLLAMLLNPSLLLATPLAWVLDAEPQRRGRRFAGFAGASVGAFVLTGVATRFLATGDGSDRPYDEFRIEHLQEGVRLVAGNIAGSVRDHVAVAVVVAAVAIVATSIRHLAPRSVAVYASVPTFALGWFLLFSTNGWVIQNLHEFRYFYPLYVTFVMYVAGASTELVLATRRWRRSYEGAIRPRSVVLAVEIAMLVVFVVVALVSIHRTDVAAIDATREPVAAAREHDVRLVAGNYWTAWPTVVAGRAEGLDLIGVSYRSDPIRDEIREVLDDADGTVAVLCSGIDVDGCVAMVNEWSTTRWGDAEVLEEWPLVISISDIG